MANFSADDLPVKPHELEFFAGEEHVTIVPNFALDTLNRESQLHCIGGKYGPFHPNFEVDVPLWLALALHKKKRCRIVTPEWMELENLKRTIQGENDSLNDFQPLPFYYIEIGHMLLMHAKDTFGDDHYKIRDQFELLRNTRWSKITAGLPMLNDATTVKMNNLTGGECSLIRLTFQGALDTFQSLKNAQLPSQGFSATPFSL